MSIKIKPVKTIIVYMLIVAVCVGIFPGATVQAAGKSGYTCRKKVVEKNGDFVNSQISTDGKGDLNVIIHMTPVKYCWYRLITWGNAKSIKDEELLREKNFPKILQGINALQNNDVKLGKNGTIQFITNVYKKKNDWREVFVLTNHKGKKISSIDISEKMESYNENPCEDDVEFGKDEVVDFEVTGKYLDVIIQEKDFYSEENFIYSVQRFNIKTGKRVRAQRLERECFAIMDGYLYGSEYKSDYRNYKYTIDGKTCLWEMKQCDKPSGKWALSDAKGKYIYYYNSNGIYILDSSKKNALPKKIISAKECPALKENDNFKYLHIDNKNHFYLVIDYYDSLKMHIYEFTKK